VLVASDVVTTVYNAVPNQCDSTPNYTASGFKLDLTNVAAHKIIAMERTFMKELGLKYGDVVKIEGTGKYDGVWQIQDTMNKRYAGQHKIDLLVDKSIKLGKWTNVKLYVLADKQLTEFFKKDFVSSL
jgi:signal peptidase I